MELYLQLGHGMQGMSVELIEQWKSGTVIVSPVNITQDKLNAFSNKIHSVGGDVLFDPQMFYPKYGHIKLQAYDYWPAKDVSITSEQEHINICRELLRINNLIDSKYVLLPGKFDLIVTREVCRFA